MELQAKTLLSLSFIKGWLKKFHKFVNTRKKLYLCILIITADMINIQGIDPKMIANNIDPFEPTHPGELIKY